MDTLDHMRSRMVAKCAIMLEMQDGMNSRVDRDWFDRGREWYRAIWIECAELMDHYGGWKWWKDTSRDPEQALLEIVDIWHFGLSMRIDSDRDYTRAANRIVDEWHSSGPTRGFLGNVERLAEHALAHEDFLVSVVPLLLNDLDYGFDDLYCNYVGKNVLNFFRQDHGYRDGNYIKIWHGREDNEHLVDVLASLDVDDPGYCGHVYAALAALYPGSQA